MKQEFWGNFFNPPARYRTVPFWGWNSHLEADELRRQIGIFREMGFGGFFIHSRIGLEVPYLQKEFFENIQVCIDEARKRSMEVWLYDEDRWPSGTAGGIVSKDDRFKMKTVYLVEAGNEKAENILGFYAVKFNADKTDILSYRKADDASPASLKNGEVMLCAYWDYMQKRSWFNGECYLDTLNKEAVAEFINVTHEAYARHTGTEFGKLIPGIFNDEMGLSVTEIGCGIPYTADLTGIFQERYGYGFLENLPELFYSCSGKVSKVRYDFMNLVTDLFVQATAGQIGQWCEKHDLQLAGHIFDEDTLTLQYCFNGAAMRFYEYMQIPGIDILTERWNVFMTAKQCVSVARQFGQKERYSESYACTGWDFPLSSHKALGDWQFALGFNRLVPHIAWYTMKGEAKRDYPASISFQSPWYLKYKNVCDYFARLKVSLEEQQEIRDILLIHPIESVWSCLGRNEAFCTDVFKNIHPAEQQFVKISQDLLAAHLDYDYGDEEHLARIGKVEGNRLYAGCADYRAVLLPEMKTIRETTLTLLEKFADNGGKVFYLGDIPEYVYAEKSDMPGRIYRKFQAVDMQDYIRQLSVSARRVSLTDESGSEIKPLIYHLGKGDNVLSLFVVNFGCEFSENIFAERRISERNAVFPRVSVSLECDRTGNVYELDPATGKIYPVEAVFADGKCHFETSFDKQDSRLFYITPEEWQNLSCRRSIPGEPAERLKLETWEYELAEPNVLVLDHAVLTLNSKRDSREKYILEIDEFLRDKLKLPYRNDSMKQPYCRKYTREQLETFLPFELEYRFQCDTLPAGECLLALEDAEKYQIDLNGHQLDNTVVSWWIDPAISCIKLPSAYLAAGENSLRLTGKYQCTSSGLESIYIIGKFGVNDTAITTLPERLYTADWCGQQLPFYPGNMICRKTIPAFPGKRVFLELADWHGTALGVRVNGGEELDLSWGSSKVELTELLSRENNVLEIIVYGHRKNCMGPFYSREKQPFWNDTRVFRETERPQRSLVPCGLCGEVDLLIF